MESRTLLIGCLAIVLLAAAAILVLLPASPAPAPVGPAIPTSPISVSVGPVSPTSPASAQPGPASPAPSLRSDTPGTLTITSHPPGAEVWIDTDPGPSATTPATLTLSPITHPVLLRHSGYRDYVTSVKVLPGGNGTLEVEMEPGS